MKKLFISIIAIALFSPYESAAQTIHDSIIQKVKSERAFYETLGKIYPADSTVAVTATTIAGVKSYWFNESLLTKKEIIIYLHGGAYSLGSINSYTPLLSHMAKRLNSAVLYIEYALAPENPYPAANNEVLAVYSEMTKKYPSHKIIIMGDSAGGGLAITLVHNIQQAKLPLPNSIAVISAWIDLKCENGSFVSKQPVDPILTKTFLRDHAFFYAGTNGRLADPSELKFKNFPPVFLLVGTNEILYDDSQKFYSYVKTIQKKSKLKEYSNQTHVWPFTDIKSAASAEAFTDIRNFIDAN